MLAQSTPRTFLASDSDKRKAISMGIDLSPSQLVTHPAQPYPQDFQGSINGQGQHLSNFPQQLTLEQQNLLQSLASFNFGSPAFGVQPSSVPQMYSGEPAITQSPPSGHAVNQRNSLPPLAINETIRNPGFNGTNDSPGMGSSSASSDDHPQTAAFSRRPGSDSPRSAPADAVSFGRMNHAARQRTAQACEKCRDRKTKCTGTRPTCKRCADRGLTCVWATDSRVRGTTKQSRHSKFESGDGTGAPLSALPVPLSEPSSVNSSPSLRGQDFVQSAPGFQTTFPAIALPSHLVRRDQQKRQSWNESLFRIGGVARGVDALSIMGEPILPLDSSDEGWGSVEEATLKMQARQHGTTVRTRERRSSVSVAHLARARSLNDETQQTIDGQAPISSNFFGDSSSFHQRTASGSNEPSPPFGPTSDTSDNELTLSQTTSQNSASGEFGLHQPRPSYDAGSQLGEEMMKLLNFPGQHDYGFLDGIQPFADSIHSSEVNLDVNSMPIIPESEAKQNADEVFAQFFDADAFNSHNVQQ